MDANALAKLLQRITIKDSNPFLFRSHYHVEHGLEDFVTAADAAALRVVRRSGIWAGQNMGSSDLRSRAKKAVTKLRG